MRVLLLTNMFPHPGDPARGVFVRDQAESLAAAGVQVECLVIEGWKSRSSYLRAITDVRRRCARGGVDLVHAHGGLSGFVAVQQRSTPVVITFHGSDLLGTPNGHGGLTFASRVQRALSRLSARRARRVIVVSQELQRSLAPLACPAAIIPAGVSLSIFQPVRPDAARARLGLDERPRVLFVGRRDAPVKRFDLARAAVDLLRRSGRDVELLVLTRRPRQEVADAMNACQCLILTSSHEGSPSVVKEAMACNLPVVSTRVGDVEERFQDLPGHYLTDPNPEALAEALRQALDFGRTTGRDRVREFDLPSIAARVLRIYEDIR